MIGLVWQAAVSFLSHEDHFAGVRDAGTVQKLIEIHPGLNRNSLLIPAVPGDGSGHEVEEGQDAGRGGLPGRHRAFFSLPEIFQLSILHRKNSFYRQL